MTESPDTDSIEKKKRSRFRVVLAHVFRSAVWLPWLTKYLLFVFFAVSGIRIPAAVLLWVTGSIAIYIFSLRRSLSVIERKVTVESAHRCTLPAVVGFVGFGLFSFLIDIALATNAARRPGALVLLSLILNCGIVSYQSVRTKTFFYAMSDQPIPKKRWLSIDVVAAVGDVVIILGFIILVLAVINAEG